MRHDFSLIPSAEIERSAFDRSTRRKTTFNSGLLIPIYCEEVLPGDTVNINMQAFVRLATPLFPVMDDMFLDCHWWYCPNRLLWENFERMHGAQDNPTSTTDYQMPVLEWTSEANTVQTIYDYLGIPIGIDFSSYGTTGYPAGIRADPFLMYNLCYNQYYRDQNLIDSVYFDMGDGPHDVANFELLRRGRRKDYFTGALPFVQKGPPVSIPIAGHANLVFGVAGDNYPVVSDGSPLQFATTAAGTGFALSTVGSGPPYSVNFTGAIGSPHTLYSGGNGGTPTGLQVDAGSLEVGSYADLSNATAANVNDLRLAVQTQRLFERDARGGTRFPELILAHWQVTVPDFRVQFVEFLNGTSASLVMHPVVNSNGLGTGANGLGTLGAFSTGIVTGGGVFKSFVEHGLIMCIVSVRAAQNYQQGLRKMWTRSKRFDFFYPVLAHLGEQAIMNCEIYATNVVSGDGVGAVDTFGFQERWSDYRYSINEISGYMRSTASSSLDAWHLAMHFTSLPTLGQDFIEENPPFQRVVRVENPYPEFLGDFMINAQWVRAMPTYSVPGMMDHY